MSFFFYACNSAEEKKVMPETSSIEEREKLLKTDIAFSELAMKQGYKSAMLEYIDSNGVLLRPNSPPIEGADAIDNISMTVDSGFSIKWEPIKAEVSKSGEIGYTYGIYQVVEKQNGDTVSGTYTTIWKKQGDGKWKYVLNSGNTGLE